MVVPILRFQCGIIDFDILAKPTAYYAGMFSKADMEAKRPLIVFTDTNTRTILMQHITERNTAHLSDQIQQ